MTNGSSSGGVSHAEDCVLDSEIEVSIGDHGQVQNQSQSQSSSSPKETYRIRVWRDSGYGQDRMDASRRQGPGVVYGSGLQGSGLQSGSHGSHHHQWHARLTVELTNVRDSGQYYVKEISHEEFSSIKAEQRLLVDFEDFAGMIAQLVSEVRGGKLLASVSTAESGSVSGMGGLSSSGHGSGSFGSSSTGLTLSILEQSQFRQVLHFSLRLKRASSEQTVQYLVGELSTLRSSLKSSQENASRLESSLAATGEEKRKLAADLLTIERAHESELQTIKANHLSELSIIKEDSARSITGSYESLKAEHRREVSVLTDANASLSSKLSAAESQLLTLKSEKMSLAAELQMVSKRADHLRTEADAVHGTNTSVLAENKKLSLDVHDLEKRVTALTLENATLKEMVAGKELILHNTEHLNSSLSSQRKTLEDSLDNYKSQCVQLGVRLEAANAEIAKLESSASQQNSNLQVSKQKLLNASLTITKQEELLTELQNKLHSEREANKRLTVDVKLKEGSANDLKMKLDAAQKTLASNHEVITYLNKKLSSRDTIGGTVFMTTGGSDAVSAADRSFTSGVGMGSGIGAGLGNMGSHGISGMSSQGIAGMGSQGIAGLPSYPKRSTQLLGEDSGTTDPIKFTTNHLNDSVLSAGSAHASRLDNLRSLTSPTGASNGGSSSSSRFNFQVPSHVKFIPRNAAISGGQGR